mgnify:CR=1 FL=1
MFMHIYQFIPCTMPFLLNLFFNAVNGEQKSYNETHNKVDVNEPVSCFRVRVQQ